MSYLRADNRRKKNDSANIVKGVVILIIIFIIFYFFSGILTNFLRWIQISVGNSAGTSTTVIRKEDDAVLIKTLEQENAQLKELLGKKVSNNPTVLAAVIVRPPKSPYDTIIVDAGEVQGIKVGEIVYGETEYAIGRVSQVNSKTSVVTLFSSSNQKEDVLVGSSSSSTLAVAEGRGGGNFYIKLPRNLQVNIGDPIIWPSSELILLGTVEKIDADAGGTYSYLYFKSPIHIQSLRYVQIKEALF